MDEIKYTYDEKFEGNILIVRRTGCGKTTFVQNLGKNIWECERDLLNIENLTFQR